MKKMIISFLFLALGVANSALMAHAAASNFKAALLYPSMSEYHHTAGYISIVFSLLFLGAGALLAIKGTDNMIGIES